ncbi:MAG: hypothetical protein ACXVJE_19495 [Mucilaginibacter sp.]
MKKAILIPLLLIISITLSAQSTSFLRRVDSMGTANGIFTTPKQLKTRQQKILPSFTPTTGTITAGDSVQRALEKAQGQLNGKAQLNGGNTLNGTQFVQSGALGVASGVPIALENPSGLAFTGFVNDGLSNGNHLWIVPSKDDTLSGKSDLLTKANLSGAPFTGIVTMTKPTFIGILSSLYGTVSYKNPTSFVLSGYANVTATPTTVNPMINLWGQSYGDQTHFVGTTAIQINMDDDPLVTSTKPTGVLYGMNINVNPLVSRIGTPYGPFNDATNLVLQNNSSNGSAATEALYFGIGPNFTSGAPQYAHLIQFDTPALIGINYSGTYNHGLDFSSTAAMNGANAAAINIQSNHTTNGGFVNSIWNRPTLIATANNDRLYAVNIQPTFTAGSYTGIDQILLSANIPAFGAETYAAQVQLHSNQTNDGGGTSPSVRLEKNDSGNGNFYIINGNGNLNLQAGSQMRFTYTGNGYNAGRLWNTGDWTFQNQGTYTDIPSALVSMNSTTQGLLIPSMTTTQKNAISSPATGLIVYDNTLNAPAWYSSGWITAASLKGNTFSSNQIAPGFIDNSAAPSISLTALAGTGATATVTGTNGKGYITLNTGTGTTAGGTVFTLTFSGSYNYPNGTSPVISIDGNQSALPANCVLRTAGHFTNQIQVNVDGVALLASSTFIINYNTNGY